MSPHRSPVTVRTGTTSEAATGSDQLRATLNTRAPRQARELYISVKLDACIGCASAAAQAGHLCGKRGPSAAPSWTRVKLGVAGPKKPRHMTHMAHTSNKYLPNLTFASTHVHSLLILAFNGARAAAPGPCACRCSESGHEARVVFLAQHWTKGRPVRLGLYRGGILLRRVAGGTLHDHARGAAHRRALRVRRRRQCCSGCQCCVVSAAVAVAAVAAAATAAWLISAARARITRLRSNRALSPKFSRSVSPISQSMLPVMFFCFSSARSASFAIPIESSHLRGTDQNGTQLSDLGCCPCIAHLCV